MILATPHDLSRSLTQGHYRTPLGCTEEEQLTHPILHAWLPESEGALTTPYHLSRASPDANEPGLQILQGSLGESPAPWPG